MNTRRLAAAFGTLSLVSACGAPAITSVPSASGEPTPGESAAPAAIVGEWERVTRCEEIVFALREAGMDEWVLDTAAAFVPDVVSRIDPERPCIGAVPVRHSHFFTAEGAFGSRDQDGEQVDDGTYRLVDESTFVVSKEFPDVTFHYSVDGDTIMFEPVIPDCRPDCFEAVWAVTVAYPGHAWTRVGADETPAIDLDGTISFTRAGDPYGDETIFIANADGSGERQLTSSGEFCCPALSPDGARLLTMTESLPADGPLTGATIAIDAGDVERLLLTDPTLNLVPQAWSPDGTRIAFEGWMDTDPSRAGVYTAAYPAGGDVQRLTTAPDGYHDIPADWSPDGQSIVFYRSAIGDAWDQDGSLWVVGAEGGEPRQIETPFNPSWWARWSPDGSKLLFASGRLEPDGAIWTADADGSNLASVFTDADGRFPITPTWSPDGQWIMFALDPTNDEFLHEANGVYVIRADGSGLALVIAGDDFKRRFDWND